MTLIQEREIIRRIPIVLKEGKNRGRIAGHIYIEKNKEPYFFIEKLFKKEQMFQMPKLIGRLPISVHIIPELEKHNVRKVVYMIIGYEKRSFFVGVPLADLKRGKEIIYDELQRYVRLESYPRIYDLRENLDNFV